MADNLLESLSKYSRFIVELLNNFTVEHSTVKVWSDSPYTGIAEGQIFFSNGIRLRMREELDFDAALITSYGYEVYQQDKRLYWYDDFPHPNDKKLALTFPHHKHVPPDMKHNRVPAPEMSFIRPNLSALLQEIEELVES